eukprot:TRINITY_DN7258_c0_g1_i2.p1 TRINITY_DN7258_c0_g1~~TRINITY_DN7258_c0_g1_i2.p1  ORF type:complete len:222 (+),score=47.84 TRINITY_DN7258_c0_g1_i2:135-800(+)
MEIINSDTTEKILLAQIDIYHFELIINKNNIRQRTQKSKNKGKKKYVLVKPKAPQNPDQITNIMSSNTIIPTQKPPQLKERIKYYRFDKQIVFPKQAPFENNETSVILPNSIKYHRQDHTYKFGNPPIKEGPIDYEEEQYTQEMENYENSAYGGYIAYPYGNFMYPQPMYHPYFYVPQYPVFVNPYGYYGGYPVQQMPYEGEGEGEVEEEEEEILLANNSQ